MLQNVKLQNVMLQMNLDVNLIEYPVYLGGVAVG